MFLQAAYEIVKKRDERINSYFKKCPDDIKELFGMSKKAYKATLTKLRELNKITIDDNHNITFKAVL